MNKLYENRCKKIRSVMEIGVEITAQEVWEIVKKDKSDPMTKNAVVSCLAHYMPGIEKRKSGEYGSKTRYVRLT